jgi:hypothetical protein
MVSEMTGLLPWDSKSGQGSPKYWIPSQKLGITDVEAGVTAVMMATILEMGCGEVSIGQNTDAASTLDKKTWAAMACPLTYIISLKGQR